MIERVSKRLNDFVSTDAKVTFLFVILGLALWLGAQLITDSRQIQLIVLFTVGIIIPTLINELRE
ncbi:hypothetical protein [Haloquadratum walsbyi]|uniref:Uncharacterized protein n=1 Tax=Haloquadratum walsbyi (strain DSM 16790 / HBSQ001) TaxID=362976 RepID=J7RUI8_HALWD|nr:hypothetical protein [Haloquadratum walsbyi]CCL97822.1 uncharacterized protein HQ_1967A [Haloquadratum walsbyi DSM 16790]